MYKYIINKNKEFSIGFMYKRDALFVRDFFMFLLYTLSCRAARLSGVHTFL